ncbi:MAG: carbamoyl-phosphate synthase small chain [Chthonomonas sp.]
MARSLLLSDGSVYQGAALGADTDAVGEVVFNTGMTGYQEVLTDPSYAGQIVLFTYPLIGNYGINDDDFESASVKPVGIVVKEACDAPSNWRSKWSLDAFMKERRVPGIQGVDTRAITKHIRSGGVAMGMITDRDPEEAMRDLLAARTYDETDFVEQVSTRAPYAWSYAGMERIDEPGGEHRLRLAVLDCGVKYNILRRFAALGCRSIVLPHTTTADEVLAWEPDGVLFSPGPGDPARLPHVVDTARGLFGKLPIFGICLGNQILCQALGGSTFKLKFGHRGANHPVQDLESGKVTITSQNHGYAVAPSSLDGANAAITQLNVNDGTVEGIRAVDFEARSIQYHPEAAPGPWDSRPYFVEFVTKMEAMKR